MTTSAPVVWCSNPNSEDDKPTAFALQGIKLEGNNVSEQHVLAVRELINAAANGKLLLPGNGQIVLLNCGVGVGSLILQDGNSQNKENEIVSVKSQQIQQQNEFTTNIANEIFNKYDEVYQFLCCARCMERGKKFCIKNVKMFEKCVTNFTRTGQLSRQSTNGDITHKRRKTVKFKRDHLNNRKVLTSNISNNNKSDIYATVNKSEKVKNRKKLNSAKFSETPAVQSIINIDNSEVGRKTSFDSTCTVSSMDSGFMDMQNKLECIEKSIAMYKSNKQQDESKSTITITEEEDEKSPLQPPNATGESHENKSSWSFLSIPTQSKNRRKSYEEFKLMFKDSKASENYEKIGNKKDSSSNSTFKNRRHSIEERNDNLKVTHEVVKSEIKSASSDNLDRKIFESTEVAVSMPSTDVEQGNPPTGSFFNRINRKNSKQLSDRKAAILNELASAASKDQNNKLKDFEKLISCGTIYDIIQKKNEFYSKTFKKYDKYMTYGTLYEILHRKFDETEDIDRKSTLSQKKYNCNQSFNCANIEFDSYRDKNHYKTVTAATDTSSSSKISHSSCISSSASPMKQGSNNNSSNSNNQISTTSSTTQLSTIYDILQNAKLESSSTSSSPLLPPKKERTRFLVQRITEEDLMASLENSNNEAETNLKETESKDSQIAQQRQCELKINKPSSSDQQQHQQFKRSRRISNIALSNPLKLEMLTKQTCTADINTLRVTDRQIQLESKIDELYTRLNRIGRLDASSAEQQTLMKIESSKIFKSSSMGILNANESEINRHPLHRPLRKISVPSQKPPVSLPVPKKASRRLSEFTRGEFLNEKS